MWENLSEIYTCIRSSFFFMYIKGGEKIILLDRVRILNFEYLKLYVVLKMCKIFDALRNFKTLKAS